MIGHTRLFQPNHFEHIDQLCFQQSPGNSASPEVNVLPHRFREFSTDNNIGQKKSPPRTQDSRDLAKCFELIRCEIQDPIRDNDINAAVLHRKRFGFTLPYFDVC